MPPPRQAPGSAHGTSLEGAIARVLQVGTYVSVALIALGTVLQVGGGGSPVAGGPPFALERVVPDILASRPAGFLWLGIVGVLTTPGLRVLRALLGFWRRDERRMAVVSILVLIVIGIGVVVGFMSG